MVRGVGAGVEENRKKRGLFRVRLEEDYAP